MSVVQAMSSIVADKVKLQETSFSSDLHLQVCGSLCFQISDQGVCCSWNKPVPTFPSQMKLHATTEQSTQKGSTSGIFSPSLSNKLSTGPRVIAMGVIP
jgi:hypothetical protein